MSILSGQSNVLNDGDNIVPLIDIVLTYGNMLNDCTEVKVHNKVCKQLVTSLCKTQLNSYDPNIFGLDRWDHKREYYVKTIKPILVYNPPRGGRNAQINIINAIDDVDNLQIEAPGFCWKLNKHYVEIRDNTVVFDITNDVSVFKILYDNLKIFNL